MATEVKPLQPVLPAQGPEPVTADQRYWASFTRTATVSTSATAITGITVPAAVAEAGPSAFTSAAQTSMFAVTTAPRIQLFSTQTRQPVKSITRVAPGAALYSGQLRRDGKLVAAGTSTGLVQLFDASSRAVLRSWKDHGQPVRAVRWHPRTPTSLLSGSDDGTVKLWDLAADQPVGTWGTLGSEYVRTAEWLCPHAAPASAPAAGSAGAAAAGVASGNTWASGSFDGLVRIWDQRVAAQPVLTFKLADPVESVLPLAGATQLAVAAGTKLAALDLVAARPVAVANSHRRAIAALALASGGTRVLTGGLDGHVKVFETSGWTVVAAFRYPSPVLSVGVVPDHKGAGAAGAAAGRQDRHLVVGLQSGVLSIRSRIAGAEKARQREKAREMDALLAGTLSEYDRQKEKALRKKGLLFKRPRTAVAEAEGADIVVDGNPRTAPRRLVGWEVSLRRGHYSDALDSVLNPNNPGAQETVTLLTALRHRSALRAALGRRDEHSLQPVLRWIVRALNVPRLQPLAADVAIVLLDEYAEHMGESAAVDALVARVHEAVRANIDVVEQACRTSGMLELLG